MPHEVLTAVFGASVSMAGVILGLPKPVKARPPALAARGKYRLLHRDFRRNCAALTLYRQPQ